MQPTRQSSLARAVATLAAAGIATPEREARLLLRWALELDATALARDPDAEMSEAEVARFDRGVALRAERRPLSQIAGERAFWGRDFRVTAATLDPRPETEALIAAALEGTPAARIADLGTGTGCILISLLAEWPEAEGLGTDISQSALAIAAENAARHAVGARARWRQTSWLSGEAGPFDLIVSNPPYVTAAEHAMLAPETRLFEPLEALVPAPDPAADGLGAYRALLPMAASCLVPGGRLLLEIGWRQGPAVVALAEAEGFEALRIVQDLDGRDRVVAARMPL
ncbi:MAG: peptide chain release factor N(5)-glutamine methyltransferase [Pseudomonadota bacterium]